MLELARSMAISLAAMVVGPLATVGFAVNPLRVPCASAEMSITIRVRLAMLASAPDDCGWQRHMSAPKLSVLATEKEPGKGGVSATERIKAMEVVARIPLDFVLRPAKLRSDQAMEKAGWAAELTAAALTALHHAESDTPMKTWIQSWQAGGWGGHPTDLGAPGIRYGVDDITGSLLATGSNNDEQIYAAFKFPTHPVVYRASLGLASLTRSSESAALAALLTRGAAYRAMRDELLTHVTSPSERSKGSMRDRRTWDVADMVDRVLSRATSLAIDGTGAATTVVVPLHERLAPCAEGDGANTKLEFERGSDEVLLVATREIAAGEAITRDYSAAPRLPEDTSDGALRDLLQFGVLPTAWAPEPRWEEIDRSLDGPAESATGRRDVAW